MFQLIQLILKEKLQSMKEAEKVSDGGFPFLSWLLVWFPS